MLPETHDVVALRLASACWRRHLDERESTSASALLRQMDAILEFLPWVPESMHTVMTERAWCILSTAIQLAPPARSAPLGLG